MTTLEITNGCENVAKLEIVWPNPNPVRAPRRRRSFERAGERARCILQDFVNDRRLGYWTTTCDLEVVAGGRAA